MRQGEDRYALVLRKEIVERWQAAAGGGKGATRR
jgi:hypothetical protein